MAKAYLSAFSHPGPVPTRWVGRSAALVGLVLAGGLIVGSDRFPLISTWALGVTMSLPWFVYAGTGALLSLTVLNLLRTGRPLLGLALVFLFLTHLMLPLTYFNLLVLAGFLLIAVDAVEGRTVQPDPGRRKIELPEPGGINPSIAVDGGP